jgi:hypothetical protein
MRGCFERWDGIKEWRDGLKDTKVKGKIIGKSKCLVYAIRARGIYSIQAGLKFWPGGYTVYM